MPGATGGGLGGFGGGLGTGGPSGSGGMSGRGLGMDSGYGGGNISGSGVLDGKSGSNKGAEVMNAAMGDPLLIEVRIGGLLTLYMTPEETETQAKTEETAAKEAAEAAPAVADPSTSVTPPTVDGITPGSEAPVSAPSPDATPGGPADGNIPGETGSSLPSDPSPTDTTSPGDSIPSSVAINGAALPGNPEAEPAGEVNQLGPTTP